MAKVSLLVNTKEALYVAGNLTLNISCDNVYAPSSPGDWTQNNVAATTTISIVANKNCTLALVNYDDGTNVYSAVLTMLSIAISSTGTVTQSTPQQYTSGGGSPVLQWFSATQNGAPYTAAINYAASAIINTGPTLIDLLSTSFMVNMFNVTSPTVSDAALTITNNAGTYSYTFTAVVSGATSCKYIDNSLATYAPTSWSSVNTAYNAAGALSCPVLTPGSAAIGNWATLWQDGKITLVMWANTLDNANAYTTANFGP
jgi:hypothetical protein